MKNNTLIAAALPSIVIVAALLLSIRSSVSAESLIGYGSVLALIAVVSVEYRLNWKRVFGRE